MKAEVEVAAGNGSALRRTALVTGSSSGLGAHFAGLLLREGYNVVIAARRLDRLEAVAKKLGAGAGKLLPVAMDVTQEASVAAAFDQAIERFGSIDTVIANAGVNIAGKAVSLKADDFDNIMNVNVRGVFLTAREAAKRMLESDKSAGHKRIILVASIGGLRPLAGLAAYSASKAAVVMMGQCLAREWIKANINVNVVCPGFIRTELNEEWFSSPAGQRQIEVFPRQRLMEASHLDGVISFLASPASDGVTGSVFKLDDGQTL